MVGERRREFVPRLSIEAECGRRGTDAVVVGCAALIRGDDSDVALIVALGGPHAERVVSEDSRTDQRYWTRVWAMRGLLHAAGDEALWDDVLWSALRIALRDEAWRVREMALKVVARHLLGDAMSDAVELRDDPIPRVRRAAERAIVTLTTAGV